MGNERTQSLLIGKDIPWKQFQRHHFRVEHFLPLSYIEQGKIKEVVKFMPYATLRVYDPDLRREGKELLLPVLGRLDRQHLWEVYKGVTLEEGKELELLLPVLHKLDFQHLWEVYKERGVTSEEEVEVIYEPPSGAKRLFGKTLPHLRIKVNPRGSMEYMLRRHEPFNLDEYLKRTGTIAEWDPMKGRIV